MTKIIIIDNGGQFTHLEGRAMKEIGVDYEIIDNETPTDIVWGENPDGIILSGGPSIEKSGNSSKYLSGKVPVLGICLGHQIIANHFGGKVEPGEYGGFADIDVEILEQKEIFEGLDNTLSVWASHKDQVTKLPDDFLTTAKSNICKIEAMKHSSLPIYGVQWHPEVSHTESGLDIFKNFLSIASSHKKKTKP